MTSPGHHARRGGSPFRPTEPATPPSSGRWQFGLAALFGTMLLLCLPFALWGALLRADPNEELALTLLCISLPIGFLAAAATLFSIVRVVRRFRRAK